MPALDNFRKELKSGHPWAVQEKMETQEMLDSENSEKDFQIKPSEQQ